MIGWARYGYHKKCAETHYAELEFLHSVRSMGSVLRFILPGARNIDVLFFTLRWARCGYHKKRAETCYVVLVFLHLVRSVGSVLWSGASGAQNIDTLFFML
jgi:hypothetical protein